MAEKENRMRTVQETVRASLIVSILLLSGKLPVTASQAAPPDSGKNSACRMESIDYKGWKAQRISNAWLQLVFVPQNGGRLMQVSFDGHDYLFVNPEFAGKYIPPNQDQWFNYGGDKLWLLPEGDNDEQHWRGNSDLLDDGHFDFRMLTDTNRVRNCLDGPARSSHRHTVFPHNSVGLGFSSRRFSRIHEKHQRPYRRVGYAVGLAV